VPSYEADKHSTKLLSADRLVHKLEILLTYRHLTHPLYPAEANSEQRLVRRDSVAVPWHRIIASQWALRAYVLLFLSAGVLRTAHAEDVNDASGQTGASQSAPISPEVSKYVSIDAYNGSVRLIHARVIDGTGAASREDQTIEIKSLRHT
jgi:hypothetical protein